MKLNWNFLGERGLQNKKPSVGGGGGSADTLWNCTINSDGV